MKIISIKKNCKNKYQIELDNGETIKLYDNVILKHNLLFKKEISDDLKKELEEDNNPEEVYYQVVKFISKKMRSKKEVKDFINKYNLSGVEQQQMLEKLEKNRFINDEIFCRSYIQDRMLLSSDGPEKIYDDLINKNIKVELINKYLEQIDEDEVYQKLEKIVLKKLKMNTNKSRYTLYQKLIFEFINLGYSKNMIEDLLLKYLQNTNKDIVTKEYYKLYRKLSSKYEGEELEKQIFYKLKQKGFSNDELAFISEK